MLSRNRFRQVTGLLVLAPLLAAVQATESPAAASSAARPAQLQLMDLGTLNGGCCSFAEGINDLGEVVGSSDVGNTVSHAFLWRDGEMTDLGTLGGFSSRAMDINNRSEVVGASNPADSFDLHAFLWRDGEMTDLGTLGGSTSSAAGVNDAGEVVGYSTTSVGELHAFLWRDGAMTDLGTTADSTLSFAYAINNRGQVVGQSGQTPVVWRRGVARALALPSGGTYGAAQGNNDRGGIAGYTGYPSGLSVNRATLWRRGTAVDLGTLGGDNSMAFDVNNRGQVVGWANTADGGTAAFVWRDGVMTNLGALGWNGTEARAVNRRGQVVGNGQHPNFRAVLWQ